MKRLLFFLIATLFLLFPGPAFAEDFVIDAFNSDIVIQEDGTVTITETITVDYRENEKHGIFREIPYVYSDDSGNKTYTKIAVKNVLRGNTDEPYDVKTGGTDITIKIGDVDRTVSGRHVYQITYGATGILRAFPEYDELYWNVTGNGWETNIDRATATVTLPENGLTEVICYQGTPGSQDKCNAAVFSPRSGVFTSARFISEGEGMTIAAAFKKGMVPILTVQRPKSFWEKFTEWPSLLTFFTGVLGAIGFVVFIWYTKGRDQWFGNGVFGGSAEQRRKPVGAHETIVVEFTPPEKLRPAEIGVLMDEHAHTSDIVATIIDLAGRGFLSITEVQKKWLFGSTDYELKKHAKETTTLLAYEKLLLENLFHSGNTVKISTLKKTFYEELKEVKDQLYSDLVGKNLFPKNPEKVWENYLGIGIVLVIFGGIGIAVTIPNDLILLADICAAVVVAGIFFVIFAKFMPHRSAKGRELYRRSRGYRLFIEKAETHRQQFFEKKNLFNEVLPYAMMFGLTDKFTSAMRDIGIKTNPTWYHSAHPFTYAAFGASMNNFASGVGTAIASTPSSSGGFSGGSSGGGFGGGGGGSW